MVVLYVVILFYNSDVSSKRLWIKERNDKRGGWNRGKKGVETSNNPGPCGECGWVCVYSLLLNWWIKITQKACVCVCVCVSALLTIKQLNSLHCHFVCLLLLLTTYQTTTMVATKIETASFWNLVLYS